MTEPEEPGDPKRADGRFFYGRRLGPYIGPWIACLIAAGLIYAFETAMPAFHDVVKLLYFVVGVIFVIVTARALRSRSGNRRRTERRRFERRDRGH